MVRTADSHSANRGPIPRRVTLREFASGKGARRRAEEKENAKKLMYEFVITAYFLTF